jgi:hypothetical protein
MSKINEGIETLSDDDFEKFCKEIKEKIYEEYLERGLRLVNGSNFSIKEREEKIASYIADFEEAIHLAKKISFSHSFTEDRQKKITDLVTEVKIKIFERMDKNLGVLT